MSIVIADSAVTAFSSASYALVLPLALLHLQILHSLPDAPQLLLQPLDLLVTLTQPCALCLELRCGGCVGGCHSVQLCFESINLASQGCVSINAHAVHTWRCDIGECWRSRKDIQVSATRRLHSELT